MAKDVQIDVNVNTKDAVKNMSDLDKELKETTKTLGGLQEQSAKLQEQLEGAELGSKEFKELRKELIAVNTEIKNQELAMEALDNEQVASELKSVAGGFVDMAGGMALVGASNKSLEKVVQTMAQVEGATKIVTGAIESYQSMVKLSSTITGVFSKAVQFLGNTQVVTAVKTATVTAATWLWNTALAANPIGLIIAGITAFIAGITLLITNIDKIVGAFKSMMGIQSESQKAAERTEKSLIKLYDERIKKLNEVNDQIRKNRDTAIKAYQDEIDRLESLGQATEKQKLKLLETAKEQNKILADNTKSLVKEALNRFNLENKTNFESLKAAREYYEKRERLNKNSFNKQFQANITYLDAVDKKLNASLEDARTAQNDYNSFLTEQHQKATDNYKKELEKRRAAEQELINRSSDAWTEFEENRIESLDDGIEKERQLRLFQFEQQIKDLDDNIEAERALRIQAEEKLQEDLSFIEYKWQKKNQKQAVQIAVNTEKQIAAKSSVVREETLSERVGAWQEANAQIISKIQEGFEVANQAISSAIDIARQALNMKSEEETAQREERFSKESEALKASLANREMSQKEYDNKIKQLEHKKAVEERQAARKAFQQDKAFRLSQAVMGTAQAVISGLSAPFPLGIVMAALNAATGAANIGIIASQKFKAAKGGVVPGTPSNIDSVDSLLAPGEAVINSNSASMFPQTLSAINQAGGGVSLAPDVSTTSPSSNTFNQNTQQEQRVYVVESDITDTQNRVGRIEESASFG